jgi:hypothetical protein
VALDDVPKGGDGNAGKMAKSWMQAAGQEGIPAAFLIESSGRIAWIGHPTGLDAPLEELAAGRLDIAAARARFQKEQAQRRTMNLFRERLQKAQQSGDARQMLAVIDEAIAAEPSIEASLGPMKYSVLAHQLKDREKADAFGIRLVETVLKDDAQGLNGLAWTIVAPEAPKAEPGSVKLALKAALRADALTQGKDAGIADTVAKAYFDDGDPVKALEAQERAVRLAKGTPLENDPDLKARLEQYRKAVTPR